MNGAPVTVATVNSRAKADLIVGMLISHGLRAATATDDAGGQEPQWQLYGVRVLVPSAEADAARELIDATEDPASPAGGG